MPLTYCPECGHKTRYVEGVEKVFCKRCGYPMKFQYSIEVIKGNPVTYLMNRAKLNSGKETEVRP
jgi:predicted amidophosphoribosyltransferase